MLSAVQRLSQRFETGAHSLRNGQSLHGESTVRPFGRTNVRDFPRSRTSAVFNPWLNMHRPCMLASDKVNTKGKLTERYLRRDVKTPLEALKQLCDKELARLKEGVSLAVLLAGTGRCAN